MTDSDWYDEDTATFGDRLAGAREAAGLSQHDLAVRLGVNTKTLQAWEDDRKEPRANRLQMLAGMLDVSLGWLLTGRGEGIEAPPVAGDMPANVSEILVEMRGLRTQIGQAGERLAQLEKKLRMALKDFA
ncbi:MAG: helix-turn-helix domain-containing protein [Limimaricola sp.]|uniref:helix-turn-helix domain-containing protein n=1 Tax=Limimaricola sp. TaxID=2211665 RepID=UPI001DBFF03D|nr:helix-turn-helix domain-containing protein [Limimaricola sp.]MBI1416387.1 helix-turn-helix domain-containing protein [Limimaricola sp.]